MTSHHLMAQVLPEIPYKPTRMSALIKATGRSDSNLREILIALMSVGLVKRLEEPTKKGNSKIVYWKRLRVVDD